MKTLKVLILFLFGVFSTKAQSIIIVQHGNQASTYTSLASAVAEAPSGADIYLSGGTYHLNSYLYINKKLHIIGAGHHPDSTIATRRTVITGSGIYYREGSDYSSIEGVYFDNKIRLGSLYSSDNEEIITGLLFKRIYIDNLFSSSNGKGQDILIKDSYLVGTLYGQSSNNVTISNCVIGEPGESLRDLENSTIVNNIIFCEYRYYKNYPLTDIHGSRISGNIFIVSEDTRVFSDCANNELFNNIYTQEIVQSFGRGSISQNNQFNIPLDDILINVNSSAVSYEDDYHLTPNSPAKGTGLNGEDIGLYGGVSPYKEGAIPSNPHIQFVEIASQTDSEGKLKVHIKVSAQNN